MFIPSPLRTLSNSCSCVEVFLRHPRCAQRSTCGVVNSLGRKTDRRAALSTFTRFSMIIGAPIRTNSRYRVGHDHPLARLYLIVKCRGYYSRRKASPVSLVSSITILRKCYCSSHCNCTSKSATNCHKGGIPALVASSTRRIVKGIFPTDERIDRKSCEDSYYIRCSIRRGPFFLVDTRRRLTASS